MNDFSVTLRPSAFRTVQRLPDDWQAKIFVALKSLSGEFRPAGSRRLRIRSGYLWRCGNFSIYYTIDVDLRQVQIVQVLIQKNEPAGEEALKAVHAS
jgi:mRNA-degrading endonuclease RelE of RelBE toxin-antitoxin system